MGYIPFCVRVQEKSCAICYFGCYNIHRNFIKGGSYMQEIYGFLKKCGTYYLATMEGDQPRVRPFGTIDLFDGKLTIQTGKVKDVSRQILQNPKI